MKGNEKCGKERVMYKELRERERGRGRERDREGERGRKEEKNMQRNITQD